MDGDRGPDLTLEQVRALAAASGLPVTDEDLPEVTYRFTALQQELERLRELDLSGLDPLPVFGEDR